MTFGALPAAAQEERLVLEEVYVTGSRIARDGFEYASPVDVFTAEDLAASGVKSVDEFLMRIPAFTGAQLGASTNNGNTGTGAKMVDLRGLGNKRTLVLIDGRRQVGSFIGDSSDVGAVDLNGIPMSMIERIEVLKDGETGAPQLHLHGAAAAVAGRVALHTWSVSLSHDRTRSIALVVAL